MLVVITTGLVVLAVLAVAVGWLADQQAQVTAQRKLRVAQQQNWTLDARRERRFRGEGDLEKR